MALSSFRNAMSVVAFASILLLAPIAGYGAASVSDLKEEQREVDTLLEKVDSVEMRKVSPRIFALANRLLKEEGDAEARPYFEQGLQANSWALEEQLTLGEILGRAGDSDALRKKAEMVLRVGEENDVLERASRMIDRPLPGKPKSISEIAEKETVLVLVPLDEVSLFTVFDIRDALASRLGMKVIVASAEVRMPKVARTAREKWVERTREQILSAVAEQPALTTQLAKMGFTLEQVRSDTETVVAVVRKTTEMEQGAAAVESFDAMLQELEGTRQWNGSEVISALQSAVDGRQSRKQMVLGVMAGDIFEGTSNFLFGLAPIGDFIGIVSVHRFYAAFNDEAPDRERLKERLLKQSLSTLGFMLGVPRCQTPECARAYPQSLAEHDQKPSALCSECRAEFENALGRTLPKD